MNCNHDEISVPKVIVFSQFSSFLDRIVLEFRALGIDFADIAAGSEVSKILYQFKNATKNILFNFSVRIG